MLAHMLDNAWVRRQFPSLTLSVADQPVAYFDNPAGTQVPERVIDRMRDYFLQANGKLSEAIVAEEKSSDTYKYDPKNPVPMKLV